MKGNIAGFLRGSFPQFNMSKISSIAGSEMEIKLQAEVRISLVILSPTEGAQKKEREGGNAREEKEKGS